MHATCVQHACKGSAIHFTCKACMVTQLLCTVLCDLSIEYWGVILNLMYKKASLSFDTKAARLQLCMNLIAFATETISFSHIATPCMNPNLMH